MAPCKGRSNSRWSMVMMYRKGGLLSERRPEWSVLVANRTERSGRCELLMVRSIVDRQ